MQGYFITGTDTNVGKTQVTCWLVRWLQVQSIAVGACKPMVTGAVDVAGKPQWEDLDRLSACQPGVEPELISRWRWRPALAPPVAARISQKPTPRLKDVLLFLEQWRSQRTVLLTEGVGGLLCPLTDAKTVADLAQLWGQPIVVVAHLGLGTLNHTLLTLEAAARRGLEVLAVVLNQSTPGSLTPAEHTNPDELRRRVTCPVVGPIMHQPLADTTIPPAIAELGRLLLNHLGEFAGSDLTE